MRNGGSENTHDNADGQNKSDFGDFEKKSDVREEFEKKTCNRDQENKIDISDDENKSDTGNSNCDINDFEDDYIISVRRRVKQVKDRRTRVIMVMDWRR